MDWKAQKAPLLKRLRERFLSATPGPDYWESDEALAFYDESFGARIRWKWEAVFRELDARGASEFSLDVVDWGCGSGVAGRAYLEWAQTRGVFPKKIIFWDRSARAANFAAARVREEFPQVEVEVAKCSPDSAPLLLLSHVLNELGEAELRPLQTLVSRSKSWIWVEPGSQEVSRRLSEQRQRFRADFAYRGPCTHQKGCGMLEPANEAHWCHSFAEVPSEIFADGDWVRFAREAGIDLRSLPYAYLAAVKKTETSAAVEETSEWTRIVGRPRKYKGYAKVQTCDGQHGVQESILQKRDAPRLFKKIEDLREPPFFRFERSGTKIVLREGEHDDQSDELP